MKRLVGSDNIRTKEVNIFTKVLQWINHYIDKENDCKETDIFNEFKYLIRFPLMSRYELLSIIFETKMLSDEELFNILRFKEFGSKIQSIFNINPRNSIKGIYKNKLLFSNLIKFE